MTTATTFSITATIDGGRIRLSTPFRLKDRVKALPGARWDARRRQWHVPATPAAAKAVCELVGDAASLAVRELAERADLVAGIKGRPEDLEPIPNARTKPWTHQLIGYHMIASQPAAMLAYDMGTGKSKVIVDATVNLQDVRTVLICCPSSVVDVWPGEFAKHAPGAEIDVIPLRTGSTTERARTMNHGIELANARNRKAVAVVNYEAAWRGDLAKLITARLWDMVVCDEIHRIKSPSGQASKFMAKVKAAHRVGLTGTPMPHSPLDVYAQYRFLDPGIFGTSFVRFRGRYAVMGGFQQHQVIGYQHHEELQEKFYSIAHRVKKTDVLDLPEVIHETRTVELRGEAHRLYYELENEFISEVAGGTVTAANALARLLRLQQITSGFAALEDGQIVPVDVEKRKVLGEILDDLPNDEPLAVFCRFRNDLDVIQAEAEAAGRSCMELSGRTNQLAEWQRAEGGEVLAVQIQAGGVGIDLTRAAYCVYY